MRWKIATACLVAVLAMPVVCFAKPIDELAEHLCFGKDVNWKEVLTPPTIEFIMPVESAFESLNKIGKCKSYKISKDLIILDYDDATIRVDAAETKGGLVGVHFKYPRFKKDSFDKVKKALDGYPGKLSVVVKGGDGNVLFAYNPDLRLATGSSFKLFILKALLDDIHAGKRHWSDVAVLDRWHKSAGSGTIREWVDDTPMTLGALATLMISISDNTATDILVDVVGREKLEKEMPGSVPFLKTRELFVIKLGMPVSFLKKYEKADAAAKRQMLQSVSRFDISKLRDGPDTPIAIGDVEWFASASELADVILSMKGEEMLAVNPGVIIPDKKRWRYIGYKGGSEPGVIQYTELLQTKAGRWYAISTSWNDPEKPVDDDALAVVVNRLADLIR